MTHEMPLVIFTIAAALSAGSFITLGIIHVLGARVPQKVMDRVTDPALYAIGPLLLLGLMASMFHLGSPLRAINSIRHFPDSPLSVEIVAGMAFLGLGALFAVLQWFKWGGHRLRQIVAMVTALVGAYLVYAISQVYSLRTVPAWATFHTPLRFFITALLVGGLAVGAALVIATYVREKRGQQVGDREQTLVRRSLEGIALGSIVMMGLKFIGLPAYIGYLGTHEDPAAQASLRILTEQYGFWSGSQTVLVFLAVTLMSVLLYLLARGKDIKIVMYLAVAAFALVLVGEFIGRQLFYAAMVRTGM
ncbi:dimethyl sulfoxide reductase anchor subunit [Tessaracoccus sp. SD287]|uniref:dimethyl sulfoxide reductase anchor subunit family protein n=1 Tax=Tessaracoccus sp. SD287 TaxID=2782008 RepID=UPI001A95C6AE|nr:DmsC/YnfH family molybdoenzyme membrane anchor subunit [Tessaracoccus sp. SD287]MBO1029995.1 dimethyl sulfoxide reductase anchor subunit [Tessaracoccus sp. SD287]